MANFETVEESVDTLDPLYQKQREGAARMRASLLACADNPSLTRVAINNITVLRIYHQVSRIIKYIEMMDKIEAKLYESMDRMLETADPNSNRTWMVLLEVQERLQRTMIESHKLLQPYLDLKEYTVMDLTQQADADDSPTTSLALDASTRDKIRTSAQAVLTELNSAGGVE